MPFIILCAAVAFIVQLVVLFEVPARCCQLRWASLILLELFPLCGALYYAVRRPGSALLGWEFGAAMCLWIAGAVLSGYFLAWVIYWVKQR